MNTSTLLNAHCMTRRSIVCCAIILFFPNMLLCEELADSSPYGPSHSHEYSDVRCQTAIGVIGPDWGTGDVPAAVTVTECNVVAESWDGTRHKHYFTNPLDVLDLQARCIRADENGMKVQARATIWDQRPLGGVSVKLISTQEVPK